MTGATIRQCLSPETSSSSETDYRKLTAERWGEVKETKKDRIRQLLEKVSKNLNFPTSYLKAKEMTSKSACATATYYQSNSNVKHKGFRCLIKEPKSRHHLQSHTRFACSIMSEIYKKEKQKSSDEIITSTCKDLNLSFTTGTRTSELHCLNT
jgi:hypothetical protein